MPVDTEPAPAVTVAVVAVEQEKLTVAAVAVEEHYAVTDVDRLPVDDPAPTCDGDACEREFNAAVLVLERTAARLGFALLNATMTHAVCGHCRTSCTDSRRRMRELLRKQEAMHAS